MKTIALEEQFVTPEIVQAAAQHEPNDPLGNFKPLLRSALEIMGMNRLRFAVDFPYSKNAEEREFLDALPLGR